MSQILIENQGCVLHIVLNRAEKHNALEPKMIHDLTRVMESVKINAGSKVVMLSAQGESFCAGADLEYMKSMANFTSEQNLEDSRKLFRMFDSVRQCPLPVIAKAHGNIFGGGLGLLAAADIVALEKSSKLCFSEAKLGLVPAVISGFVSKKMNPSALREMALTARVFTAQEAQQSGLAHFVGETGAVDDYVNQRVQWIKSCGPEALRETKLLLDFVSENSWPAIKERSTRIISERRVSSEGQEGLAAFLEKRAPAWKS